MGNEQSGMMKERLSRIIKYKTGGSQKAFSEFMGWKPAYTNKLLRGVDFGLTPVVSLLEKLPEINARWLVTGEGDMLSEEKKSSISDSITEVVKSYLDLDELVPVMTPGELATLEEAIKNGTKPDFDEDTIHSMRNRATARKIALGEKFKRAKKDPDPLAK